MTAVFVLICVLISAVIDRRCRALAQQLQRMLQHADHQSGCQWPPIDVALRSMTYSLSLMRLEFVQLLVNRVELRVIVSMGVSAAGGRGDTLQGIFIQCVFTRGARIADRDRVNDNAFVLCNLSRLSW